MLLYLILTVTGILTVFFIGASLVPWAVDLLKDRDVAPDTPWPFGYRTAWLALHTTETDAVVRALALSNVQNVNWRTGVSTIYDNELGEYYVFVSPPVSGWTFVSGLALPHPVGSRFVDNCMPMLIGLSKRFSEVQYFFTYPVIELYAWARFSDGKLVRAFAWGDDGAIWNKGPVTQAERELGLKVFALRRLGGAAGGEVQDSDDESGYPGEEHVFEIARQWSFDPTRLDREPTTPSLGHIGEVPPEWQVKRKRHGDTAPGPRKRVLGPVG